MNSNRISIIVHHGDEIVTGHRSLFVEPRFNTWAAIGIGVSVAGLGTSVGMAAAGVGQPTQPNLSSSSQALSNTNAALLPIQRGLTAAQQTGGEYTFSLQGFNPSDFANSGVTQSQAGWYGPDGNLISPDQNFFQSSGVLLGARGPQPAIPKGVTWKPASATVNGVPIVQNKDGTYTANFKGYGQGDVQSAIADKSAASQLALSQKYDPQFIAEALKQQQEADPESFAARNEESKLIQDQINRPINSPVSDMLNSQVQDSLDAANNNKLTDMDTQRLNAAVAQAQGDRGGSTTPADFAEPLTSGFAGEQRQQAAAQAAMGFLASGSSPEDIAYRREQQNLGNLSAEVSGKTPESQFGSMSGAQSGPTPMVTASPLPVMPGGQDQAAAQVAIQNAQTTNRFNNNQINPWMQGLSSLINVGSIAGNAGWKPFAPAS